MSDHNILDQDAISDKPESLQDSGLIFGLGIVSLVLSLTACGIGFIPGIICLIKAKEPLRLINENPGKYADASQVTTGRILGLIGTIIGGLMFVFVLLYFVFIIAMVASGTM